MIKDSNCINHLLIILNKGNLPDKFMWQYNSHRLSLYPHCTYSLSFFFPCSHYIFKTNTKCILCSHISSRACGTAPRALGNSIRLDGEKRESFISIVFRPYCCLHPRYFCTAPNLTAISSRLLQSV